MITIRTSFNSQILVQHIRSYVSPIVHYGVVLYGLGAETKLQKILRLPPWASVLGKLNELKIGTVFEYHIYEQFKFSLAQIRIGFQNLTIGIQQRQTRNVSCNIWNFSGTMIC